MIYWVGWRNEPRDNPFRGHGLTLQMK